MTFAQNLANDLATVFLDTSVFAVGVSYHPNGGADIAASGDFQEDGATELDSGRGRTVIRTGTLTLSVAEVPTATRDDTVTIASELWSVVTYVQEHGAWIMQLQRSTAVERTQSQMIARRL